jgi:2-dehydro-3-deoxygluconokinase
MKSETKPQKIITFGEVLMRLSPPNKRLLGQSNQLDFFFGGTEANVAMALANWNEKVDHVSAVPDDFLGESSLKELNRLGVGNLYTQKNHHPLGLYFMEEGTSLRASQVIYNRLYSSFANIAWEDLKWEEILKDADIFHWTGITPGISENTYQALKYALATAANLEIKITVDPTYRKNLWKYGRDSQVVLKEFISCSNIFIGGTNEINQILDTNFDNGKDGFVKASKELMKIYPSIKKVFDKVRVSYGASIQRIYSRYWNGKRYFSTLEIEINPVIDRIGTGDAFVAGIIYTMDRYDEQSALNFANASCALKHTIVGDANLASEEEIWEIANGQIEGRIKR